MVLRLSNLLEIISNIKVCNLFDKVYMFKKFSDGNKWFSKTGPF